MCCKWNRTRRLIKVNWYCVLDLIILKSYFRSGNDHGSYESLASVELNLQSYSNLLHQGQEILTNILGMGNFGVILYLLLSIRESVCSYKLL